MKKILKTVLLINALGLSCVFASGSQFGLINQSLGNILVPYSASGVSRSYEIAHMDSMQLNMKNFATWTDISRTTLFLNSGYDAIFGENRVETSFIEKANFQGVAIGIPIIKRQLTFGLGLQPFTSIEHRVLNTLDQGGYDISENYNISGGLSKANFNFAYKLNDMWAVALGYEFTFGRIDREIKSDINTPVPTQIEMSIKTQFSGHGIVLSVISNPLPNLNVGLMLKPSVLGKLTKSGNSISEVLNTQEILDTSIPTEINFGLEYNLSDIYALGFDLTYQDWKKGYEIEGANIDDYNTYYYLGFGFERKGSGRRFVKYLEQIDYRAGLFYSQLAYLNNTESVVEYGVSAGLSVPIQRFRSKIDLGGFIS